MFGLGFSTTLAIATMALSQTTVSAAWLRRLEAMKFQVMDPVGPYTCLIENGFDYAGFDIDNKPGAVETCCDKCHANKGCVAWSWSNLNGGTCWLKSGFGPIVVNPNVKSSRIFYDNAPYCKLEQDADFVGNDIANKPSGNAEGCCSICQNTLGCRAYSWSDFNGGTCWLKSSAGQKVYKAGVKAAIAYPNGYPYSYCPVPTSGVDYVGNDIGNKPSSTPEGCCDVCKQFNGCRAYSWTNQNGGTCWLKSAKTGTVAKAGVTSAQIFDNTSPSCSAVENDIDYVGNDIGNVPASDSSKCCSLCGANSACKAWSWSNYNGGTCWLKSGKGATAAKGGVKSAVLV